MQRFERGQIWGYKTRAHESASKLYIAQIDVLGNDNIYHIFVDGLSLKNRNLPSGIQTELPHAPVDQKSLDISVTDLLGYAEEVPDISEGYAVWREAFDRDDAGSFNISIAEIVQYIEDIVGIADKDGPIYDQ